MNQTVSGMSIEGWSPPPPILDRRSFYIALEKDKLRQANAKLESAIDRELIKALGAIGAQEFKERHTVTK